ncbi:MULTISPECIES: hypothetical protein [Catenuloplanes]|uniref:DUF4878 domain-containing protein n=1 Tax=Catenuloplanes niger TaxID=587534 RepID=A0AAE3ZQD9_9ACTN|nr:hypothetical protein [Catenuloplanes niger]MDR7321960.1 hypothetical protein [Catenuloplanes niger]
MSLAGPDAVPTPGEPNPTQPPPPAPAVPAPAAGPSPLTGPNAQAVPNPPSVPAPPPPPGPGVAPPFPAPPVEGRAGRIWLGVGIATAVAALCCGGGAVAAIGIGLTTTQALTEQAQASVGEYLDALADEDYSLAYSYLCDEEQASQTRRQFIDSMDGRPVISSYQLGELDPYELLMPAQLTYSGGQQVTVQYILVQDTSTAQLEVCGTQG